MCDTAAVMRREERYRDVRELTRALLFDVQRAIEMFYHLRGAPNLKKRPSTSELLDWLRLLVIEGTDPAKLQVSEEPMEVPPMVGALIKNEQDMQRLVEYLSARRAGGRTW